MPYTYDPIFAVDPQNPANVAKSASITIFDPADATQAPVAITDPTGVPLPNPMTLDGAGMGPAFQHPTLARVGWKGAGFVGYFTSYEGMFNETQAAKTAAQTASANAASAAQADLEARIASGVFKGDKGADGSNVLPTDTAIKDAINNTASATRGALNATYAGVETVGPYKAVDPDQMQYISGAGAFAGLRAFLDGGAGSAAIQVMGDSTGGLDSANKDHWVWKLTQWLAAEHPALTVRYRVWEMGGAPTKYINAETVQEGSSGWCSYTLSGAANTTLYLDAGAVPNFTGDSDVAAKVDVPVWPPAAIGALASKTGGAGNVGWQFYLQADGKLLWQWSSNGTNVLAALSTVAVTMTPNVPIYLKAMQDVDNGAGGNTVTFYTSTNGTTWTQLGAPVVSAFVTSHHATTANVQLGGTNGSFSGSNRFVGRIYEAWIRDGINGPTIAPVNALDWLPGPAAVANIGWVLDIVNGSWAGRTVNDLNTKYAQMTPDLGTVLTILNDGHNDTTWLGPFYTNMLDAWKTNVMSRLKRTGLAVTNQNPEVAPATYRKAHGARQGLLAAWASRNGATILNIYKAFLDDPRFDNTNTGALYHADATGVHPSPAGWTLWAEIVKRAVKLGA